MIVKHDEQGWEIISHYTHGLLAGKIASQIKKELMPKFWMDFITGVVEHDDHLLDFGEEDYLTKNGTPKDFTMEKGSDSESLEHAERVFSNSMQKSQLVALVVGRHLEFLYESLAQEYGPMKKFLEKIAGLRKKQRKLYGINKDDEDGLYNILRFSDRVSLIICQDEVPKAGRKLEINNTIEGKDYFIQKVDEDQNLLTVTPWPFEKDSFQLELEYRILKTVKFRDNKELERELANAPILLRRQLFKKQS